MTLRHALVTIAGLLGTMSMPAAALSVFQDSAVITARASFGGMRTHDWDAGGAPGSVAAAPGSTIDLQNYIDGDGFEGIDLALGGVENFTLTFATPVRRVGFAVATGTGRYPGEVNQNGADFTLVTNTGDIGVLTLAPGPGFTTWAVIQSASAFTSLQFVESGDLYDQYFGDVLAAGVPEPSEWALMLVGLIAIGTCARMGLHRRQFQRC